MHRSLLLLALATAASASAFDAARRAPEGVAERDFSPFHRTRTVTDAAGVRRSQLLPPTSVVSAAAWGAESGATVGAELKAAGAAMNAAAESLPEGWPTYLGTLKAGAGPQHFAGACFKNTTMEVTLEADGTPVVNFDFAGAASKTCSDVFLLLTSSHWAVQYEYFTGTDKTMWYPFESDAEKANFMTNGIRVMLWKGSWHEEISFLYTALQVFERQDPEEIVGFLESRSDIKFTKRVPNKMVTPKDIAPGDVIGAWHPAATQTFIAWGTGRAVGHSAIILDVDGVLHVAEMNTKDDENKLIDGLNITPLKEWLDVRHKTGMTVWWMRLEDERRAAFNNSAAVAWYNEHDGEEYGYPVLVGCAVDTVDTSLPPPLTKENFFPLVAVGENMAMRTVEQSVFQPLAARMKKYYGKEVDCHSMECLIAAAGELNTTAMELMTLVETEDMLYPIRNMKTNKTELRTAYVCDTFVLKLLQVGGSVSDVKLDVNEFTPRDMSDMGIYKKKADYCDNEGDYHCVLVGDWTSDLRGQGLVKPYDNMFNHCGYDHPSYDRTQDMC